MAAAAHQRNLNNAQEEQDMMNGGRATVTGQAYSEEFGDAGQLSTLLYGLPGN